MQIRIATSRAEIEKCFLVMVQLRENVTKDEFLERVIRQQQKGYQLVYIENNNQIVGLAGFRIRENLSSGKFLWVEDLITDSNFRSKGYGDKLIDWLSEYARKEKCKSLQLDSGVQRHDAHRFYMKKCMYISAYKFVLPIKDNAH